MLEVLLHRMLATPLLLVLALSAQAQDDPAPSLRLAAELSAPAAGAASAAHAPRDLPFAEAIARAAAEFRLDPALLHAVVATESAYNPKAVSPKGAIGLMQLMPDTARRYGVRDARPVGPNLRGGAAYLADLLRLFGQDLELALAAYNAGENAVLRHGGRIPPYRETRQYVPRVLDHYARLRPAETRTPGGRVKRSYLPALAAGEPG